MKSVRLELFRPGPADPVAHVLARKGHREIHRREAHYRPVRDEMGSGRLRVRAGCYLYDRDTGEKQPLFEGPAYPMQFRRHAGQIAEWLGITQEEAALIRHDQTTVFEDAAG
jgi:hypothetical protein